MVKLSRNIGSSVSHISQSAHRRLSHKFAFWLTGLALAFGGLTLAQAGNSRATPAAKSVADASVRASATSAGVKSVTKPSTKVKVETHQSNSTNNSPKTTTNVTVNGHSINVPKNGRVETTVPDNNGNSKVDISVNSNSQGSATNDSSSSSNINIYSQSNSFTSEEHSP